MISIEKAWQDYEKKLSSYINSKVAIREDAEDILNDVFERLTKAVAKDSIPENISSWLYSVAKNKVIDYYRTRKSFQQLSDDSSNENINEASNIIQELSKCMLPMIQALPETYQKPLMLSEIEGKNYKEVAFELSLSVSAVKSRILRGRKQLYSSMISCCTMYQNDSGETIDYEHNLSNFCSSLKK